MKKLVLLVSAFTIFNCSEEEVELAQRNIAFIDLYGYFYNVSITHNGYSEFDEFCGSNTCSGIGLL